MVDGDHTNYGVTTMRTTKAATIEAYGIKGTKNTRWRKTFRSYEALQRWAEKNDAEVQGTRELE